MHTPNHAEEIYAVNHELWHKVHPQKQHTSLQNRKITFFQTDSYRGSESTVPQAVTETQPGKLLH